MDQNTNVSAPAKASEEQSFAEAVGATEVNAEELAKDGTAKEPRKSILHSEVKGYCATKCTTCRGTGEYVRVFRDGHGQEIRKMFTCPRAVKQFLKKHRDEVTWVEEKKTFEWKEGKVDG